MKYQTFFCRKLGKMSQILSSAAVIIGALRVKRKCSEMINFCFCFCTISVSSNMPMSLIKDCYTCFKKITRYNETVIDYCVFEYNVDILHLIPISTLAII